MPIIWPIKEHDHTVKAEWVRNESPWVNMNDSDVSSCHAQYGGEAKADLNIK